MSIQSNISNIISAGAQVAAVNKLSPEHQQKVAIKNEQTKKANIENAFQHVTAADDPGNEMEKAANKTLDNKKAELLKPINDKLLELGDKATVKDLANQTYKNAENDIMAEQEKDMQEQTHLAAQTDKAQEAIQRQQTIIQGMTANSQRQRDFMESLKSMPIGFGKAGNAGTVNDLKLNEKQLKSLQNQLQGGKK